MTRKEEIAVIKKCEKTIYDYQQSLCGGRELSFRHGLIRAETILYRKRKRLEKKLKK